MATAKFYRVKFPTDTLWARLNEKVPRSEVQNMFIKQAGKFIEDNMELVEVDEETRAVVPQSAEGQG